MDDLYKYIIERYKTPDRTISFTERIPGFFEYIFKDGPQIRKYNSRFDLLRVPYFSKKIELKEDFIKKLRMIFTDYINPLRNITSKIIVKGWRFSFITIKDYNLIVYFSDFASKFEDALRSGFSNHKTFMLFEDAYLKFSKDTSNVDSIINSCIQYLKTVHELDDENRINIEKLRAVFSTNMLSPSITDMLVSYTMYHLKRYVTPEELVYIDSGEIVTSDFYICPKGVFEEIVYRIQSLLKEIKILQKDRDNLQWLKDLSEVPQGVTPDKIIFFYDDSKKSWHFDSDDLFKIMVNLFKDILDRVHTLIYTDIQILDIKTGPVKIKLLETTHYDILYQKMYNDYYQLRSQYISTVTAKVPLKDYIEAVEVSGLFNDSQMHLYDKFQEILKGLSEIALKINKTLANDQFIVKSSERNRYMITSPEEIKGKSPHQAVYHYLELFLQICGFFHEEGIKKEVADLNRISNKLEEAKKELNRIRDKNNLIEQKLNESGEKK